MNAARPLFFDFRQKVFYLPQGGFNPGPAPDGSTELPNRPSTKPCRTPAREKFRFCPKEGLRKGE
jgi:hypothetical protein